jgi:ectoine hydroxylase-related dioxygenase (phytanoyl-CoA dioxygenase family)
MPLKGILFFHDPHDARNDHTQDMFAQMETRGLAVKRFVAKRGEVLLWHGSLVHGGSRVETPARSRQSFVVHFDAARNRKSAAQSVVLTGRAVRAERSTRPYATCVNGSRDRQQRSAQSCPSTDEARFLRRLGAAGEL